MMFGSRDEFEYFQCSKCECLQIVDIPKNLGNYYPSNYYSFSKPMLPELNKIKRFLRRQRTRYYLSDKGLVGSIIVKLWGASPLPIWVKPAGLHLDSKILDVGCGAGNLLIHLHNQGFTDLTGIDPYIQEDRHYRKGVQVLKKSVDESSESFEFIMLHHSFEHVPNPIETLKALHKKIEHDGLILIRIPIVSSFAWRKYKTNWVQLDAPRHLFLHSIRSMEIITKQVGFKIESIVFDSNAFQFWGSEEYMNDIPFYGPKSYRNGIDGSIFTENDIKKFQMKAEELNAAREGDQACFFLRKINVSS